MTQRNGQVAAEAMPLDRVVALARPLASSAQVVVVSGERGSGRTTLLRQAVGRLDRTAVWIDAAVFAASRPLESLREVLASSTHQLIPGQMADQLERSLAATPLPSVEEVGALVWKVIRPGLPGLDGRVVVVDDLDLLDPASQQVAAHVLHRVAQLGGSPVLFAVESGLTRTVGRFATVGLPGLSTDELRLVIEDDLGVPIPYRTASCLAGATGGNVLAATDIVRRLSADQLAGRDLLPHPLPLGGTAAQRLVGDSAPPRSTAVVLAGLAMESTLTLDQARALVGSGHELDAVLRSGGVQLHRQLLRASVPSQALAAWELAPIAVRRHVHAVLGGRTDLSCSVVHRALAGDEQAAVDVSEAAPALVREREVAHLKLALDLLDWALPGTAVAVAQQLMDDGYVASVERLTSTSTTPSALPPTQIEGLQTQVALLSGHVRDRLGEPGRRPPVGADPDEWARSVLGTVRALIHREDLAAARRLLDATADDFAAAPPDVAALALFVRAELGYHRREEWALTELSRAATDWLDQQRDQDPISTAVMVFYLLAVGNSSLADAVLNRTEPPADAGALTLVAHLVGRLQTEIVRGHFAAADDLIVAMDQVLPYADGGAHTLDLVIGIGAARGARPDRDRIEWRLDHPDIDVASHPPQARSEVAAMSGLRSLVERSYDQAFALLDQALRSRSALFSGATAVLANLLETHRALGATAAQNRALRAAMGDWWPDRYGERFVGLDARCRALCADEGDLDAAFRSALDACDVGFPFDLARTRLAYGRCLQAVGRPEEADRQLDRAAAVFANERLHGWVAHVAALRTGPRPATNLEVISLTPTEREIVSLVLRRRTNAEIARSLFMSKRTIELHLTRIFRKLGVARKSELVELENVRELVDMGAAS